MITKKPSNWKNFQSESGRILEECGFNVEIEKTLNLVRGKKEVDVYAEETIDNRNYSIIIECKFWNSSIPQDIIHSLLTIAEGSGVNKCYLLASNSFQSGAVESAKNTIIKLTNWEDFQKEFFTTWYLKYFSPKIDSIALHNFDKAKVQFFENFTIIDKKEFFSLVSNLNIINIVRDHFPNRILISESIQKIDRELIPLKLYLHSDIQKEIEMGILDFPEGILNALTYRDFIDEFEAYSKPVIEKLKKLNLEDDCSWD